MNEIQIINDKITTLEADSARFPAILNEIANGGDLITISDRLGIPYSELSRWIQVDGSRAERYKQALELKVIWSVERIIKELQAIALVDVSRAYRPDGSLLPMAEIPEDVRRCIVAVESEELFAGVGEDRQQIGIIRRIKWSDKLKALETLGRRFAMWIDRIKTGDKGASLEELIDATMRTDSGE